MLRWIHGLRDMGVYAMPGQAARLEVTTPRAARGGGMSEKVTGITSRIWVGVYNDKKRSLGWMAPKFIEPGRGSGLDEEQRRLLSPGQRHYFPGDLYRCRITIQPVRAKRGRLIVRRNPVRL